MNKVWSNPVWVMRRATSHREVNDDMIGNILIFVPPEFRTKVLKSKKELPKIELLFQFYDLSKDDICFDVADEDFEIIMKILT